MREQPLRENAVLQALFFNNKIPNDPLEPDTAGGARGKQHHSFWSEVL